jgi:hypothetical protein
MRDDDPEAYRSEVLGEFRTGVASLLDPDVLQACVVDRLELPPADTVYYAAFCDPSGGSRDAFTCAIAHADGERVVIDCVRAWSAPFNPSGVVAEVAELLATYRISCVTGDRYAGQWPGEACRSHAIEYEVAELDRSRLYLELLPMVNSSGTLVVPIHLNPNRRLEWVEAAEGKEPPPVLHALTAGQAASS